MKRCTVTIINETGLHARPANQFVQASKNFTSDITIKKGDASVDAKSILGVLTLGAGKGSEIIIEANGEDEEKAVEALAELIESGFKE